MPYADAVLVIVCGLMRYWRFGFEALRTQVFDANPSVQFGLALLTSPRVVCTDRDRHYGECPCMPPLPANLTAAVESAVPSRVRIVHTDFSSAYRSGLSSNQKWPFRLALGWDAMAAIGLAARFRHVIVLRPDVALTQPLHIPRACRHHAASLAVISGAYHRPMPYFHDRDWDYALLACEPQALAPWLRPWQNSSVRCSPREPLPALPPTFSGPWNTSRGWPHAMRGGGARHECAGLVELAREARSFGTLDRLDIFARLLVSRTVSAGTHAFGKLRAEGCARAVNYSAVDDRKYF